MTDAQWLAALEDQIRQVVAAETNDFRELAGIAGLDLAEDLAGADLSEVDLSNANLSGANLSGADLSNTNLSGADLRWANLTEANLAGADLNGTTGIRANLKGILYKPDCATACPLTLFMVPVAAGSPSPTEDYIEGQLDLNQYLIRHPAMTFFVRASGDSMIQAGVHPGDLLVVDRALEPRDGSVVIAVVNGELTVKRLSQEGERLLLLAENDRYCPLEINEHTDFQIWGVVTNVIHDLR